MYQQQQIDALVGQVKNLVSVVRATQASSTVTRPGNPSFGRGFCKEDPRHMERGLFGKGPALSDSVEIHSPTNSQKFPERAEGYQNIQTQSVLAV